MTISMIPADGTVVIDGYSASGVDFTGIDPSIHAIQWYGEIGEIEYVYEFSPIVPKPVNSVITSLLPYQSYVTQAQLIIEAQQNAYTVYSTSDATQFYGNTYPLGFPILIDEAGMTPPVTSTPTVPPTPEDFQTLYWYQNAWLLSSYDPTLSLAAGKAYLNTAIESSAAGQGVVQARIYSPVQLSAAPSVADLNCADYGVTLGVYQTYLDNQVATMQAQVNAATSASQLYGFDYRVPGEYTP